MTTETKEKEVGFLKTIESATALVNSFKSIVIKTADDYTEAEAKRKQARDFKKMLLEQYEENETVRAAKEIQRQKIDWEKKLDAFNKDVKAGPMDVYEKVQAAKLAKEEARLAEIERKKQEAETARQVAEQKRIWDAGKADREAAEKAQAKAEAERIAAENKFNAAKTEAARAKAKADADAAEARVAQAAYEAHEARLAQDKARQEAEAIKADAKAAPAPVVVLERTTPQTSRRKVFRWRLTTKDGRKILKADFTAATRLKISELGPLPASLFVLSPVLLNELVDSMGEVAAIPGILEIRSEMV